MYSCLFPFYWSLFQGYIYHRCWWDNQVWSWSYCWYCLRPSSSLCLKPSPTLLSWQLISLWLCLLSVSFSMTLSIFLVLFLCGCRENKLWSVWLSRLGRLACGLVGRHQDVCLGTIFVYLSIHELIYYSSHLSLVYILFIHPIDVLLPREKLRISYSLCTTPISWSIPRLSTSMVHVSIV